MTVTIEEYFNDATFIASSGRIKQELGIVRGQEIINVETTGGTDLSSELASDDFENPYYAPLPFDLSRTINATSPYLISDSNPANPNGVNIIFINTAFGIGVPRFSGYDVLSLINLGGVANRLLTAQYGFDEPTTGVKRRLDAWEAIGWYYDDLSIINETLTITLRDIADFVNPVFGIRRNFNTGVWEYLVNLTWTPVVKAIPLVATWVGTKIVYNPITQLIEHYVFNLLTDSDWVLVAISPATTRMINAINFEYFRAPITAGTKVFDFWGVRTNIDYRADVRFHMAFDFNSINLPVGGGAGTRWRTLESTQINTDDSTGKLVTFDIYDVATGLIIAENIIDNPTDLSKLIPDDTQIYIVPRFNNSDSQVSPRLSMLRLTYDAQPTVQIDSLTGGVGVNPAVASVSVADAIIVDMSGTVPAGDTATVDEYKVDFGDGNETDWVSTDRVPYVYSKDSSAEIGAVFVLKSYCRNTDGIISASQDVNVTVLDIDAVPKVQITPVQGTTGVTIITADMSESFDPNTLDTIADYSYDWGDGTVDTGVGSSSTHQYLTAGTYRCLFKVLDTIGGAWSTEIERYITITDAAVPVTIDITSGGTLPATFSGVSFKNISQLVLERILNKQYLQVENLDDKEQAIQFTVKTQGTLAGQNFRDNLYAYFENDTLLRIQWQTVDAAGNPDVRYFTGYLAQMPHNMPTTVGHEEFSITMVRED